MADGITINYEFVQPEVGASQDTWGAKLNANWASIDNELDGLQTQITAIVDTDFSESNGILITGTLVDGLSVSVDVATAANLRAGVANKIVDAESVYNAAAFVTLTDAASITPNFNAGRNFVVTLGGNRTLDNPTNQKSGQSGVIVVRQDATGGRTLVYGSHWEFPTGSQPIASGSNDISMIGYIVLESGTILASQLLGFE